MRVLERTISWGVWLLLVLWLSGLLPVLLEESDQLSVKVGASELTLRNVLEGALTVAVALLAALWLSSLLEARLLRAAHGATLSLRKVAANAVRALLVFVAVLVALSAVGIDLTALSVLGGAIGVGIGLGLQKLAANYVSVFVVLAERAIRIGDAVRVDGFDGVVTDIRARYTVIRNNSGRESIVPNEMMVTQRVENQSLADRRVWASTVVSVGYDSDIEQVLQLLRQAAMTCPRVLREPPPNAFLSAFGADGLECTLGYWMNEPEGGSLACARRSTWRCCTACARMGLIFPTRSGSFNGATPRRQPRRRRGHQPRHLNGPQWLAPRRSRPESLLRGRQAGCKSPRAAWLLSASKLLFSRCVYAWPCTAAAAQSPCCGLQLVNKRSSFHENSRPRQARGGLQRQGSRQARWLRRRNRQRQDEHEPV